MESEAGGVRETVRRFEALIQSTVRSLTQRTLPLQKKCYQCSIQCIDKHGEDLDSMNQCVQQCQSGMEAFGQRLSQEFQTLESQITSCQQTCHNKVAMAFKNAQDDAERKQIQEQMDACVTACFHDGEAQVDQVQSRLRQYVEELKVSP